MNGRASSIGLRLQRSVQQTRESSAAATLQAELEALRQSPWYQLTSLQQHGAEVGVSQEKLVEATSGENPEQQLMMLILEATDNVQGSDQNSN